MMFYIEINKKYMLMVYITIIQYLQFLVSPVATSARYL